MPRTKGKPNKKALVFELYGYKIFRETHCLTLKKEKRTIGYYGDFFNAISRIIDMAILDEVEKNDAKKDLKSVREAALKVQSEIEDILRLRNDVRKLSKMLENTNGGERE